MKCPACSQGFELTWARYLRAWRGRMSCPTCGAPLRGKHRWFYWLLLPMSFLVVIPIALPVGLRWGAFPGVAVQILVGVVLLLPLDKWLESQYSILVSEPTPPV